MSNLLAAHGKNNDGLPYAAGSSGTPHAGCACSKNGLQRPTSDHVYPI
ncbi:hypothetical protein BURMUCGD1_4555 [Burkholderia multivorans CGD1]|nr:hypothetical protein BURMUCGD1_4555 [Burkholderia multivorans CGD1]